MQKTYQVTLSGLNGGRLGVQEIVVHVRAGDADSAIKIARKVIVKSWGFRVASVWPVSEMAHHSAER